LCTENYAWQIIIPVRSSANSDAIRGREQQNIDKNGGAKSQSEWLAKRRKTKSGRLG
jgi:hypothetical protein